MNAEMKERLIRSLAKRVLISYDVRLDDDRLAALQEAIDAVLSEVTDDGRAEVYSYIADNWGVYGLAYEEEHNGLVSRGIEQLWEKE